MSESQIQQYPYPGRTDKQPLVWSCSNPKCVEDFKIFTFESDQPKCPKCTCEGPPVIQLQALIHLLVPDKAGKIRGMYGRYKIACDPKRAFVSTGKENEVGTDDINAANCPDCLKFGKKSRIVDALGRRVSLADVSVVAAQE
jgi:hypothetical protein